MRHTAEGNLRRLVDEPLAVADADVAHAGGCERCLAHRRRIERDAATAARLLGRPQPLPNVDRAWGAVRSATAAPGNAPTGAGSPQRPAGSWRSRRRIPPRSWRLLALPGPSAAAMTMVAVVLAGAAAATVATTVFAPTHVSPVPISSGDFQAITDVFGFEGGGVIGGFSRPAGTLRTAFGSIAWHAHGRAHRVPTIAAAEAATGMQIVSPSTLPQGVGSPSAILVQPEVTATITFDARAGKDLAGRTLALTGGPAVLIEYRGETSALGATFPALATVAMERPTASSSDATTGQLTSFLLSRPGVPAGLTQEIRMLGNLGNVLPVPVPEGSDMSKVDVDGAQGVLVSEGGGAASGVIWEDGSGIVHAAFGLLDKGDILNVADQLG